jgi:hypothetical protein
VSANSLLQLYADPGHQVRDRLEILTALLRAPSFDPVYLPPVIKIPRGHAVYRRECLVEHCERTRSGGTELCGAHGEEWAQAREAVTGKAAFVLAAAGLDRHVRAEQASCRVCPGRPATRTRLRLCQRHLSRFRDDAADEARLSDWPARQKPFPGYGTCRVAVCPDLAATPLGLCGGHATRYKNAGCPGGARLPRYWSNRFEQQGLDVALAVEDQQRFGDWCAREWATRRSPRRPPPRPGSWPGRRSPRPLPRHPRYSAQITRRTQCS